MPNSAFIIKNGFIIDPSQNIEGVGDLLVENGKIAGIYFKNGKKDPKKNGAANKEIKTIDASGRYVLPGLIDMHVHLREPGFEHKENINTGTRAAVNGGFTSVCCMPNTDPVNDNATVTSYIIKKAREQGICNVYPIGAITKAQKGEELAEFGMMREAGCIGFSDDGHPVTNSLMMRRALEYSKIFDSPIISHCEDLLLADSGVMNEGAVSSMLGLKGIPSGAEDIMVARDILLAKLTGGRLHIAHVSTKCSVALIRRAKEQGIRVTAETCPHYFTITDKAVIGYNTSAKVNPPLRTEEDIEAIKEGLRDGTIDVIATDHAPHHKDEKLQEFDKAPSGISGLETALGLSLALVRNGVISMKQLAEKMCLNPSLITGVRAGNLKQGSDADIVIIDQDAEFTVDADKLLSKGKNTPFCGVKLKGLPVITIVKGNIYERQH
ncbi:MAG: dihydroorotase [Nitrospirae bacterium]|nr:MAG: dihydroorotase [Nitrospirota bacterium]